MGYFPAKYLIKTYKRNKKNTYRDVKYGQSCMNSKVKYVKLLPFRI